jgi:hypothetical protein
MIHSALKLLYGFTIFLGLSIVLYDRPPLWFVGYTLLITGVIGYYEHADKVKKLSKKA